MGLIDDWRLRNIFGRPQPTIGDLPITGQGVFQPRNISTPPIISAPPSNPPDTTTSRIPTPALDEFKAYLETQPSRKEHQLSKVGKALALASGAIHGGLRKDVAGGIGVGQGLMEQPYERAIEDWKSRGGLLEKKAGIETAERALEREIAENKRKAELESDKNEREWLNTALEGKYKLNQIQEIQNRIKVGNLKILDDTKTGQKWVYDPNTQQQWSLGQFAEGAIEKGQREVGEYGQKKGIDFKWWTKQQEIEQKDRLELVGVNHVNDLIKMDRKHLFDADLINYRWNLDNSGESVLNQNRAFSGAIEEVKQTMPDLYAEIFEIGTDGKEQLKEDATPEAMQRYANTLKNISARKLGREVPSIGMPSRTGPAGRAIQDVTGTEAPEATTTPAETTSKTTETTDPIRQQALQIIEANKLEDDEDTINEVMNRIKATSVQAPTTPTVALPPQSAAPPVNLPTMPPFGPVNPAQGVNNPTLNLGPNFGQFNQAGAMAEIQRLQDAQRRLQEAYRRQFGTGTIGFK